MNKLILCKAILLLSFNTFAVDYKYDNANRITEAAYKDGTVVSYTYDKNGNLLTVTPNKSSSGGQDTGGSNTGGSNTGNTNTAPPETIEPAKQESSGGSFGWITLIIASVLVVIRRKVVVSIKR
ncbi:GlyGly-CTERM sorting domain-containing protein [Thalassotalea euphylliae]|nr:GlyGly-CTERM sorting domain-containing protein [Thalassotalea euphylliae]